MKKMKSVQKLFRIGIVVAILAITCCVTAVFAKEAAGVPGLQMVGGRGSYSPIAPDLLVRCQDIVRNENGELETGDHGEEKVELQYFMANALYDNLPKVDVTDKTGAVIGEVKDYSFDGYAQAYKSWKEGGGVPPLMRRPAWTMRRFSRR